MKRLFIAYKDTEARRRLLLTTGHSAEEYALFGLRDFEAAGWDVHHNLLARSSRIDILVNDAITAAWTKLGGYGGAWCSVFRNLKQINAVDLVFCASDRFGIPLVLLKHLGFVSPRIAYVSVGLPERLQKLRTGRMRMLYRQAFEKVSSIICYGYGEAQWLREWMHVSSERIRFLPFGVPTELIRPRADVSLDTEVFSAGADPNRDFRPLLSMAARHPEISLCIVASRTHARCLAEATTNVRVLFDIPFDRYLDELASAKVVALPVRPNLYSGATTVLLQAMAMAKPVVVTSTEAIAHGYGLADGVNCRLVPAGDDRQFEDAITDLLANPVSREAVGPAARAAVEANCSWSRYIRELASLFEKVLDPNEPARHLGS